MNCKKCGLDTQGEKFCSNCGEPSTSKRSSKKIQSESKTEAAPQPSAEHQLDPNSKLIQQLKVGLIVSFVTVAILLVTVIASTSSMQSQITDLQDRVAYLEMDVSILQGDMTDTQDWAHDEIDSVANCVNEFIDAWSQRSSAYYCLSPSYP
ncbi:hypothetical protein [Aurantimicrobium minutum]|uniref:hypothetical protein n=1 Tax=Aurantimicrobium minutum TaxID=708131 RepID=UPI0024770F5A|nr:hypothetical protein [Aurantimicrobium minutum]MDH6240129.1 uncharacterized Zn finger protein (UPF0148 family) [Aurantimicrobium minutum]